MSISHESFLLASILTGYPDQNFSGVIKNFPGTPSLEKLKGDYIDLFDKNPNSPSLYETAYGRDQFTKTQTLSDILGFYHAFGFELGQKDKLKEMGDHLSVELEFYALLVMKQKTLKETQKKEGAEIVLDARKKFLKDHLGKFIQCISEHPTIKVHPFYGPLLEECKDLIALECQSLGVVPEYSFGVLTQPEVDHEVHCPSTV